MYATRTKDAIVKLDRRKQRLGHSVQMLANMQGRNLIQFLRSDGLLPQWSKKPCPFCGQGTLSAMYHCKVKKSMGTQMLEVFMSGKSAATLLSSFVLSRIRIFSDSALTILYKLLSSTVLWSMFL